MYALGVIMKRDKPASTAAEVRSRAKWSLRQPEARWRILKVRREVLTTTLRRHRS